ncbi:MAG: hypothetical protein Q9218_004245 [Villophora microphyllina]
MPKYRSSLASYAIRSFTLPLLIPRLLHENELQAYASPLEIGHEKAQSVIDSITSSYAAEGQAGSNPMLNPQGAPPQGFPPPPFGFPGILKSYDS